jgi:hypothetical protein
MQNDPKYAAFFGVTADCLRNEGCKLIGYVKYRDHKVPLWEHSEAVSFSSGNRVSGVWWLTDSNTEDILLCATNYRHMVAMPGDIKHWRSINAVEDLQFLEDPSIVPYV